MEIFMTQLPALIGVIIGGLISFLATSYVEQVRWRRRMETRWDERRLNALLDFAAAVKRETRLSLRIASFTRPEIRTDALSPEVGIPLLEQAEDDRARLFEAVILLAERATLDRAREWMYAVWELREHSGPPPAGASDTWHAAYKHASALRSDFYAAVRAVYAGADSAPLEQPYTY